MVDLRLYGTEDKPSLSVEMLGGKSCVYIDADEDATTVQIGKIAMTVSRTGVRVISKEGPHTGHVSCHEAELWQGAVPSLPKVA